MGPTVANKLSTRGDTAGARAFPGMSPVGGTLLDLPALVSDGAPSGALLLIDASRVAANSDVAALDMSEQVSLQMDTAPTSPPVAATVQIGMWQHNLIALKAERWFGFELLAVNGAAVITGL